MSSYGTARTLREEALLVVRSLPASLERQRRLAELFKAYDDGAGLPLPSMSAWRHLKGSLVQLYEMSEANLA